MRHMFENRGKYTNNSLLKIISKTFNNNPEFKSNIEYKRHKNKWSEYICYINARIVFIRKNSLP